VTWTCSTGSPGQSSASIANLEPQAATTLLVRRSSAVRVVAVRVPDEVANAASFSVA